MPETNRIYECTPEDLQEIPMDVQVQMLSGGRLRPARYEGDGKWHVFDDADLLLYQDLAVANSKPEVIIDPGRPTRRLDLGCGNKPKDGFEGVDLIAESATHRVDLFKFPWPWEDSSVSELHAAHFLEHVPAREVEERDLAVRGISPAFDEHRAQYVGQDFLFAMMDEAYRILVPGGIFKIVVPNARADGAFQDPTHRRYWNQFTFGYFNKKARAQMGVDHYRTHTDFQVHNLTPLGPIELATNHIEVQQKRWRTEWNAIFEWHAILVKPEETPALE